ncbi:MAG TPA: 2-phospho-L-lactate transferase [Acidimicrobiales bacterium]|nr:2-phospho-L-lactate transferase [Acidimicrobiales bacterium]
MITVLCGGVGAARLLVALRSVVDESELVAVVNVGDDFTHCGLVVCPDLDTVTYSLAGVVNAETGWGRSNESWVARDGLGALGGPVWFSLGDRDLATHLYRTHRLGEGATKSVVTGEIAARLGVAATVLPVSDDPIATVLDADEGELAFQEYFVRRRHAVAVSGVRVTGADGARPAPGVLESIAAARRVVIAPSNPLLSIGPLLAVPGVRAAISARREDVVAVSPLVDGAALKGPADRLMLELGHEASCVGVADLYRDLAATLVIDVADAHRAREVEELGVAAVITTTVMDGGAQSAELARVVLA